MVVQPGYKQSDIGVIPADWDVTTVGKEFSIQLGKMLHSEKNVGTPKPFLGNRAVRWGWIDLNDVGLMKLTPDDIKRYRLRNGDLLVCEGGEVGRAALWLQPIEECYYQKALHRLRARRGYDVRLMLHVLRHLTSSGFLSNYVTQTSIAHLPKDKFETVPIPFPPTAAEQATIAETLGDADALVESLESLLAKKRRLRQGAMQELLSGKRRLPAFNREWTVNRLGELIKEIRDGATPSRANPRNFGGPIHWVVIEDIHDEITTTRSTLTDRGLRSCAATVWPIGTLILSTGATIGEVGIARIPVATKQGICGIVVDPLKADTSFLKYWLLANRAALMSKAQGSTIREVRTPTIVQFDIRLPELSEQRTIAALLFDMDIEIHTLEARLAKARQIKWGMMHQLLTGSIRLI